MSLKTLLNEQTIIIDDHKRGSREVKNWDDPSADVHIDKSTHYPIQGKKQDVRIRIPINSSRNLTIENSKKNDIGPIPGRLKKEIQKAFKNEKKRKLFINDVVETIKGFPSMLSDEKKVRKTLERLSKHFELNWTEEKIATYTNESLEIYTEMYRDKDGKKFFMTAESNKIKIGQNNGYKRHQKILSNKH